MKVGIPEQQDHPLAPNRPLEPITWRQARAEPHGYYERTAYADGWNDAVARMHSMAAFGSPVYEICVPVNENIMGWQAVSKESYDLILNPAHRRIIFIVQEQS